MPKKLDKYLSYHSVSAEKKKEGSAPTGTANGTTDTAATTTTTGGTTTVTTTTTTTATVETSNGGGAATASASSATSSGAVGTQKPAFATLVEALRSAAAAEKEKPSRRK